MTQETIKTHSHEHNIYYIKNRKLWYEKALSEGKLELAKHLLRNYNEAVKKFGVKLEDMWNSKDFKHTVMVFTRVLKKHLQPANNDYAVKESQFTQNELQVIKSALNNTEFEDGEHNAIKENIFYKISQIR